jgi:hypothetical protein
MSRIVTTPETLIARVARLTGTPWAAAIGIIILLHRIFDTPPAGSALADEAVQRSGRVRTRIDRSASNQTPLVYSVALLTHAGQGSNGPPVAQRHCVSPLIQPQSTPLATQRRQRRRPSMLAISAALHGGAPR